MGAVIFLFIYMLVDFLSHTAMVSFFIRKAAQKARLFPIEMMPAYGIEMVFFR